MIALLDKISAPTRQLSEYIAKAAMRPLPDAVVEKARHHVLDTLAAMVSGSQLRPGRMAIGYVASLGGTPEASVVGTQIRTSAVNAALANGMLAHADETDDSHAPSRTHPGCAVIPAALAVAERCPYRKSNPDVLMVQTSKVRVDHDAANSLNSTRRWCILVER
jgi:2-methylcitrate dehydratase PrpD